MGKKREKVAERGLQGAGKGAEYCLGARERPEGGWGRLTERCGSTRMSWHPDGMRFFSSHERRGRERVEKEANGASVNSERNGGKKPDSLASGRREI